MATPTINQLNDPRGFAIDPFRYSGANAPVSQPTNTTPLILNQMDGGRGNDSIESKSTPDWGTALSIGQNLSNWGLTSVGDYIQSESRMGINSQTGAYSQEAQDQRKQEAAAMSPSNVGSRSISAPSGVTVGGPMAVERGVTGVALGPVDFEISSGITASEKGGWAASVRSEALSSVSSRSIASPTASPATETGGDRADVGPSGGNSTGTAGGSLGSTGTSGGSPADAVSIGNEGGGGGGNNKIICTRLYEVGLMPRDIYLADQAFGKQLAKHDPVAMDGYHRWASHVVRWMQRDDWFGKVVTRLAYWIATPWAFEMARRMGVPAKRTAAGWLLMEVGLKICRWAGRSPAALARIHSTP